MSLLPVETAIAQILANVPAVESEPVPLTQAMGRVLFAPVVAECDQPRFNSSSMDGYAVRTADFSPGTSLRLIGISQAGQRFLGELGPGECVRIFTGAPVPEGADAVIMQEEASAADDLVAFSTLPTMGQNIRPRGMDFHAGQQLLEARTRLTPHSLLLVAAANVATLRVGRQPSIALLATGDELVQPGTSAGPDQILAANSFGLAPLLAPYSSHAVDHGIVPDDKTQLRDALLLAMEADIVIASGGASVGDRDFLREVLIELGVKLQFWKIAMRPGKPMMFGRKGNTLVFGLPGNPVSAMVTAEILVKPALRLWQGLRHPEGPLLRLPLAGPTRANGPRRHFMRGSLEISAQTFVRPIAETDSGHMSSLAHAECLIVLPEHQPALTAGSLVDVVPFSVF